MSRHVHADKIIAWAEGAKIEWYDERYKKWVDCSSPSWSVTHQYRIKGEVPDNTKAIAAAIELLEALQMIQKLLREYLPDFYLVKHDRQIESAIQKAIE